MRKGAATTTTVVTATLAAAILAATGLIIHLKQRNAKRRRQTHAILRKFARECAAPVTKLWSVADDLASQMDQHSKAPSNRSSSSSSSSSSLHMLVSYVDSLPTGEEKGVHYGVNVRPSALLFASAVLGGKDEPTTRLNREVVPIPPHINNCPSKDMFDLISGELTNFVTKYGGPVTDLRDTHRKLGFTYISSVDQPQPPSGGDYLVKWRSFLADTTMTGELVEGINQALDNHGVKMRVVAMVDDTVGDIAGGRYYSKESVASIHLGIGTNASFVESPRAFPDLPGKGNLPDSAEMVVDMDWGSFDSSCFPVTEYDLSLDAESSNPGRRKFEKLISGAYLGEIVRRVLLKMAQETAMFGDKVPHKLSVPYSIKVTDMEAMHQDTSESRDVIDEKLHDIFQISWTSSMSREVVQEVCDIVAERAARLAGAGIVGIVKKLGRINDKKSRVTVQGGLYEHYRLFRNYLHSGVWEMLGSDLSDNLVIEPCHGGSGVGAIFLASAQSRY